MDERDASRICCALVESIVICARKWWNVSLHSWTQKRFNLAQAGMKITCELEEKWVEEWETRLLKQIKLNYKIHKFIYSHTCSSFSTLSSVRVVRRPMKSANFAKRRLSFMIFTSSGKWYEYHSLCDMMREGQSWELERSKNMWGVGE